LPSHWNEESKNMLHWPQKTRNNIIIEEGFTNLWKRQCEYLPVLITANWLHKTSNDWMKWRKLLHGNVECWTHKLEWNLILLLQLTRIILNTSNNPTSVISLLACAILSVFPLSSSRTLFSLFFVNVVSASFQVL
jgi:hypothetical protein